MDESTLDCDRGFRIDVSSGESESGRVAVGAHFNADGLDDLLVAINRNDGAFPGHPGDFAHVVYGGETAVRRPLRRPILTTCGALRTPRCVERTSEPATRLRMSASRPLSAAAAQPFRPSMLVHTVLASALAAASAADPCFAAPLSSPVPTGGVTWVVTNCDDDGFGSLRQTVRESVVSGDTIDLGFLSCSTITLATGAIVVDLDDLTIVGAGPDRITIDAAHHSRVFSHLGTGTLELHGIDIANGKYVVADAAALGGCIYSRGEVALTEASVRDCIASGSGTANGGARGGGIHALGDVSLTESTVSGCTASAASVPGESPNVAQGGGVFAGGDLELLHTTVSSNIARSDRATGAMFGGGAYTRGRLVAKYSGFFDNAAHADAGYDSAGGAGVAGGALVVGSSFHGNSARSSGGLAIRGGSGVEVSISNSTISANQTRRSAALVVGGPFTLSNSTVTGNQAYLLGPDGAAGVFVGTTATIESSIIANNHYANGSPTFDVCGDGAATIGGSRNLIGSSRLAVPPDTLAADPGLAAPVRRGTAMVYPLSPGSPAIDAGSNPQFLQYDQRGAPFRRTIGAETDIGSFEFDPDRIFLDGFD